MKPHAEEIPDAQLIEAAMREAGVDNLPAGAGDRFLAYLTLLLRWNARLNLTAVRSPEEILRRHFAESAFVAAHLPENIATLLDYGSGAGLPGIPIALCRPEICVTLAESQLKKAAFLREAVRVTGISSEVHAGRAEGLPPGRVFDAVVMRAVDKMAEAIVHARSRAVRVLALLTTDAAAARFQELAPEFAWRGGLRLPGSERAVLLMGERESVPRGTFGA